MENKLQPNNNNLSTPLNKKELEIAKELWHVNQILTYPLSDSQIEAWSISINELKPVLIISDLTKAINLVKIGRIEWDNKVGLPNIFWILGQASQHGDDVILSY